MSSAVPRARETNRGRCARPPEVDDRGRSTRSGGAVCDRHGALRDDEGERGVPVVAQREVHRRHARGARGSATVPAEQERRRPVVVGHDLHVVPAESRGVAERLDERLLRGEPGGERAGRQPAFALSEQALDEAPACGRATARTGRRRRGRRRCRRSRLEALLDGDGLRQVARLVDVEPLGRRRAPSRRSAAGRRRAAARTAGRRAGCGRPRRRTAAPPRRPPRRSPARWAPRALISWMFETTLACSESGSRGARHDDEHGLARLDQRDGAVLQLAGRESLGVDVGELLELQRALERHREADVAAEEEHRAGVATSVRELADRSRRSSTVRDLVGNALQLVDRAARSLVVEGRRAPARGAGRTGRAR